MRMEALHIKHRSELMEFFNEILPVVKNKSIKAILPYDDWEYGVKDFPTFIRYNDTMVSDEGYAIIFEDNSFLYICELFVSDAFVGLFELTENDISKINSFTRKDILNNSEYIYGPGYKTWIEYSFDYSNIESIDIEVVDYPVSVWIEDDIEDDVMLPDGFGTITMKLANGNSLVFSPEDADSDGYMDLVAEGLKAERTEYSCSKDEYDSIFEKSE